MTPTMSTAMSPGVVRKSPLASPVKRELGEGALARSGTLTFARRRPSPPARPMPPHRGHRSCRAHARCRQRWRACSVHAALNNIPRRPLHSADDVLGDRLNSLGELGDDDLHLVTSFIDALVTKNRIRALAGDIS